MDIMKSIGFILGVAFIEVGILISDIAGLPQKMVLTGILIIFADIVLRDLEKEGT